MEVSVQLYAPTALPPGKDPPPSAAIGYEIGWVSDPVCTVGSREKSSVSGNYEKSLCFCNAASCLCLLTKQYC
jgi:hypothetical protein